MLPTKVAVPPVLAIVTLPVVVNPDISWLAVPEKVKPPVELLKVPIAIKFPESVIRCVLAVKIAFKFTVRDAHVTGADKVTALPPVVAMTTSSVIAGTIPPTHVAPVDQSPPVAVLSMVAAEIRLGKNANTSRNIPNLTVEMICDESLLVNIVGILKNVLGLF
jgi:hypothetical protein